MNKWQDITDMEVSKESLDMLSEYCRQVEVIGYATASESP